WPRSSAPPWALPAPPWTRGGGPPAPRPARPDTTSPPSSISASASRAPSSISRACGRPRSSAPSTRIPRRPSSRSPTTASWAISSRWRPCWRRDSRSSWRNSATSPERRRRGQSMQVDLTDEQRMIQQVARDFAEKEVRPIAEAIDREARFPAETVRRMGELGLMGIAIPEAWGGSGGDTVADGVALEEASRGSASHGAIMSVNNSLYCEPVAKFGTDEQKRRFLSPFAAGQKLGCFSLTEPEAGSAAP